uniref:Uncharacterized protein n=1 Tax=Heterorhabditis bacteriophora TaxID=37862 RepID=A0A1I7XAQ7_HETBA
MVVIFTYGESSKDASILFTGGSFANKEVINSAFRSVCTARAATIIKLHKISLLENLNSQILGRHFSLLLIFIMKQSLNDSINATYSIQIQCKSIADSHVGLAADGSTCGSGRVCVAGSCVEMSSV